MPVRPFSWAVAAVVTPLALLAIGCAGSSAASPGTPASSRTPVTVPASAAVTSSPSAAAAPTSRHPCGWSANAGYRHVIWIWMENRTYSSVLGSTPGAPRLAAYGRRCGVATNYDAVAHPSLPNYIAATSGSTHGIASDCDPSACPVRAASLYGQVAASGRTWRGFAESMASRCDHASYGRYAARHNPAVYYPRIAAQCRRLDRRMGGRTGPFADELHAKTLPAFTFVTPNLCHDGHDCSISTADSWLGTWLDRIVTSPAYAAGRTVVFVTWDEGVGADQHIATVVVGPTVPAGTRVGRHYTHYSLLRSTERLLGVSRLGHARTAHSMVADFHLG